MSLKILSSIDEKALSHLNETQNSIDKISEQLSSGKRIKSASEDAHGVSISTNLRAQTRSLQQAGRNALDGVSMIQVAEGGLTQIADILIRLRELGLQATSDTVGNPERDLIHKEFEELIKGVDQITASTKINYIQNGKDGGNLGTLTFHIGANARKENMIEFNFDVIDTTSSSLGVSGADVTTKESALNCIEKIDKAIVKVNGVRAEVGSLQSRMLSAHSNIEIQSQNLDSARSQIEDADIAIISSQYVKEQILKQSQISVLSQALESRKNLTKLIS